jgi:hypothetical protein
MHAARAEEAAFTRNVWRGLAELTSASSRLCLIPLAIVSAGEAMLNRAIFR